MAPNLHVVPPYWFFARQETGHDFAMSSDLKISGFTLPHVIGFVADLFFSTLESGFKYIWIRCRIRRMPVDGSRIRKRKVADSEISGYVWTGPEFKGRRIERVGRSEFELSSTFDPPTIELYLFGLTQITIFGV